ncbi:MAG: SAM-dependent chlorinase/fluorinase [Acidobacteria bacterium]|nr:SAM-dependent chlorinase/fluorinase [Acidobacteriota bacterium]
MDRPTARDPIITLTTDFGLQDAYVASMKGVILGLAPDARIVDISHEIQPQGILEGGYVLSCAFRHFPAGTIHLLVVDPGVGTSRRLLLARTENHYFLAPDNGALGLVFALEPPRVVLHLTSAHYFNPGPSATFHGRDILAPVAARLARGTAPAHFGVPVTDYLPSPLAAPAPQPDGRILLHVIMADRFGNLILNLREEEYHRLRGGAPQGPFSLEISGRVISRLVRTYDDAEGKEPFALFNSGGYLELAIRNGSAASELSCAAGAAAALLP